MDAAARAEVARPHVVMLPLPNAQGHMNPMMELAKRLAGSGIMVTFITIEHAVARLLQAAGAGAEASGRKEEALIRLLGVPDGLPADAERHVVSEEYVRMLERVGHETEARLRSLLADPHLPPVTCVLADVFLDSARSMLSRLRLPRCAFWPMSATILSIHLLLSTFRAQGFDPLQREVPPFSPMDCWENSAYVTEVPGLTKLHKHYLPYYYGIGDIGLQATSHWIQNTINHLKEECMYIVANDVQGLEPEQCQALGPKFHPVGPLLAAVYLADSDSEEEERQQAVAASFWKEDYTECMEWLDGQVEGSVVYVSFGSLTRLSKRQTLAVAQGLLASKKRFLWVIRKDVDDAALKLMEHPNYISEGALPPNFLEATKQHQGKVVSWAPQMAVLRHGAVGAFFSHCGWNSVLESTVAGLPMLAWPQFSDQVTNCWMIVHEWQTGIELKRDLDNKPHPEELAQALISLMDGPTAAAFRARASLLRDIATTGSLADSGNSKQNLDTFTDLLYEMSASARDHACF
ncbi:hypothetical protein L7F22_017765 [Adiantum nelumboides]|nr:hypothetical protein [Adiantum nelumboides]